MKPARSLARLVKTPSQRLQATRRYNAVAVAPDQFSVTNVGELYKIENEAAEQLSLKTTLPWTLRRQYATLGELVTLVRNPFVEVRSCMEAARASYPALRLCLWGAFGTGKTTTLNQIVHLAHTKNWVVVHLPSAVKLTRRVQEVEMSSFKSGRINDPFNAASILQLFKQQNASTWKLLSSLKTERTYEWAKNEKTLADRPITDIVEMGISAPFAATDCVGALFRELKRHAQADQFKLLVAIDDANSLWGKTLVKRADRTYAPAGDLTLVNHYRGLIQADWTNGMVLMVADQKEVKSARDNLTVVRHTPLELFGEEAFKAIEPFIPIETTLYSEKEIDSLYEYYVEKNWLTTPGARSSQGQLEMKHLSAFNPFNFERLCAFN